MNQYIPLFFVLCILFTVNASTETPVTPYPYITIYPIRAREIFQSGKTLGNRANIFSKVGDSITFAPQFLTQLGTNQEILYQYNYLNPVIRFFRTDIARDANSFTNKSLAAYNGWSAWTVLDTNYSDKIVCQANESALACEYRIVKPAYSLIMFGTNDAVNSNTQSFLSHLTQIIEMSIQLGIVPIISTIPDRMLGDIPASTITAFNKVIIDLTQLYKVPLWDFWSSLQGLPNKGIGDGVHPSIPPNGNAADFSTENLNYGYTVRNLLALQVLDALWNTETIESIPGTPQIDGILNEWTTVNKISFGTFTSQDNSVDVYSMWDTNNVYLAFDVRDTQLWSAATTRDGDVWQDDCVEVFFDTNNDAASQPQTEDYQVLINLNNTVSDLRGTGTIRNSSWNGTWTSAVKYTGTLNNNGDTDTGYVIEISIPFTILGKTTPTNGTVWGCMVQVDDSESSGVRRTLLSWPGYAQPDVPSKWKKILFSGTALTGDTTPPSVPSLLSPPNNLTTNNNQLSFDWSDVTDTQSPPVTYELQVSTDIGFRVINHIATVSNSQSVISNQQSAIYFWRVRARDNAITPNYSNWSSTRTFTVNFSSVTTDTTPPPIPTLITPLSGYTTNNPLLTFDWFDVTDTQSPPVTYELQISTDIEFSVINQNVTTTNSSSVISNLAGGLYYWRVRARDNASTLNNSDWSTPWNFTVITNQITDTTVPASVIDLSVQSGTISGAIQLQWSSPGDDGTVGQLQNAKFKIQYATTDLVPWTLDLAQIYISTSDVIPGTVSTYQFINLLPTVTYYFSLWIADEADNWSGESNHPYIYIKETEIPIHPVSSQTKPEEKFVTKNIPVKFGADAEEVKIYDSSGGLVAHLNKPDFSSNQIVWYGKDKNDTIIESGLYIYQTKTIKGDTIYGMIILAK